MTEKKDNLIKKGLVMNSVPDRTRRDFIRLANEEFEGHYGMALREVLDYYFEYSLLKQSLLSGESKLNNGEQQDGNK